MALIAATPMRELTRVAKPAPGCASRHAHLERAMTLTDKPFIADGTATAPLEPWNDRALQTGNKLHYLSRGKLASIDW
jgi:hypothetical protein